MIILGGGAAAFSCALKATEIDAKVLMIEKGTIGGTCVNVGCVPSKNLLEIGKSLYECANLNGNGNPSKIKINFNKYIQEKDELVLKLRNKKYINILDENKNIEFISGHAKFRSENEVSVNGKTFRGKNILIATGSSTFIPPIDGIGEVDYLTNIEALSLKEKPESMIIIGGRTLGLEFAQMYSRFGTKVTVLQRSSRIIPDEEPEISDALRQYFEEEGIEIHTDVKIQNIRKDRNQILVSTNLKEKSEFRAEKLLIATGRRPNTLDIGLENTGVQTSKNGGIIVDEEMRTNIPHIYAAGDVIGGPMLETVAAKEGYMVASNALFKTHKKLDFNTVPHAVFTSPQVASVGITEEQSMEKFGAYSCRTLLMKDVPKAEVVNKTKGLIKMVIDPNTQIIVGVHILSDLAADMIHEATLAVKFKFTVDDILDTVHVFPTMSEAMKLVATTFKRDVAKLSCCAE